MHYRFVSCGELATRDFEVCCQDGDFRIKLTNDMPSHALRLKDGRVFEAELRVEEISEHIVAHLAVALSKSVNRQLHQFASKHRSPLSMMKRHRGSSNRGSTLEVDDRRE